MPTYDYACDACGPFSAVRPMAEYQLPHPCPGCGAPSARDLLSVPAFHGMDRARRVAMETNERSANAPRRSHRAGCACCTPSKKRVAEQVGPPAAKSFPKARPWMISH